MREREKRKRQTQGRYRGREIRGVEEGRERQSERRERVGGEER